MMEAKKEPGRLVSVMVHEKEQEKQMICHLDWLTLSLFATQSLLAMVLVMEHYLDSSDGKLEDEKSDNEGLDDGTRSLV